MILRFFEILNEVLSLNECKIKRRVQLEAIFKVTSDDFASRDQIKEIEFLISFKIGNVTGKEIKHHSVTKQDLRQTVF